MSISKYKISIVTPVYNQVDFIEQTILSVINQGYENLEYIIIDGGSTDGTLDIIKTYESKITKWISEPDTGMYDALNKGFALSTGDVMAWINSDDILLPNALNYMNRIMKDLPQVNWVQGLNSFIDLKGQLIRTSYPKSFSLLKFLNKDYKWVQQESTFWRRSLWDAAGGMINDNLKLAGDFELWFRFSQKDTLYTSSLPIGAWRKREGQLSGTQMKNYIQEVNDSINNYKLSVEESVQLKKIQLLQKRVRFLRRFKVFNVHYFYNQITNLEHTKGTTIDFNYSKKTFVIQEK